MSDGGSGNPNENIVILTILTINGLCFTRIVEVTTVKKYHFCP